MTLVPRLPPHAEATIHQFLRAHVAQAGATGVVIGLSGGIDSALTARLAADALGPRAVTGVMLPDRRDDPLRDETRAYAAALGIEWTEVAVDRAVAAAVDALGGKLDREAAGNVTARLRMTLLYGLARPRNRLVAGTGNKSELLLGYFTKYGDGGVDLLPIGDLYKTEVRALAETLGLPEAVRGRAPSAGLWEGQTDEGDLGMAYAELDRILRGLEELRTEEEIVRITGLPAAAVEAVVARVERNRHKRRMPPIPKLSLRTIGVDWRE